MTESYRLKPDKIRVEYVGSHRITIKEKIIPLNARATKFVASWCKQGGYMRPQYKLGNNRGTPTGITIHNTEDLSGDANPAETYTRATWPNCNMGGVVVHFYVWKTEIWQNVDESYRTWHAADGMTRRTGQIKGQRIGGNIDTISIEVIGRDPLSEDTAAKLAAYLCAKYNLDPHTSIYAHRYFYRSKYCPVWILPHWKEFVAKIDGYYNQTGNASAAHEAKNSPNGRGDSVRLVKNTVL